MTCHTTVCLGTRHTGDDVPIDFYTDSRTGVVTGAGMDGDALVAENILPCAVPSKLAAHLQRAITTHAAASTHAATFYLLGSALTESRCGDLVLSQLIRVLLLDEPDASSAWGSSTSHHTEARADECLVVGIEDGSVTCETLTAGDSLATVDRVLRRLRHITFVAARFPSCVCLLVVSTQLSTVHIGGLVANATESIPTFIYLYLGESMTASEMRTACVELEAIKTTVTDFAAPRRHTFAPVGPAPPTVSRVLNTTVSDDGRRDGSIYLDAPPPLHGAVSPRGASTALLLREVQWLKDELVRVQEDRDAAEMERRACQGVLQSYREHFSEMQTDNVALLRAISGDHGNGSSPGARTEQHAALVDDLRQELADVRRALSAAEERTRLLQFRDEMRTGSSGPPVSPPLNTLALQEMEALRRENLDLAALLQQKDATSAAALEDLRTQLKEAERAKANLERALEMQSQTIREAKAAVLAERARHEEELTGALDVVKALSRDNSRSASATNTSPRHSVNHARASSPRSFGIRQRRYAAPRGSVDGGVEHRRTGSLSAPLVLTSPPR